MSDYKPAIPAKLRSAVYFTGLAVGFVTMLATGLSAIWWPELASQVAATGVSVTAAVGWLASALGVAYRPTADQPAGIVVNNTYPIDVPPEAKAVYGAGVMPCSTTDSETDAL